MAGGSNVSSVRNAKPPIASTDRGLPETLDKFRTDLLKDTKKIERKEEQISEEDGAYSTPVAVMVAPVAVGCVCVWGGVPQFPHERYGMFVCSRALCALLTNENGGHMVPITP